MYSNQPYRLPAPRDNRVMYDRGHLAPAATFSSTLERYLSTYVYTNAVPQHTTFNSGAWRRFEDTIRQYALNRCIRAGGTLYLLTGTAFVDVQPGNPPNPPQVNLPARNRLGGNNMNFPSIYIPNSLWTAGCCVPANNANAAASFAVIGNNQQNPNLMQITLARLQNILLADVTAPNHIIGGPNVNLFPGNPNCVNNNLPNPLPVLPLGG